MNWLVIFLLLTLLITNIYIFFDEEMALVCSPDLYSNHLVNLLVLLFILLLLYYYTETLIIHFLESSDDLSIASALLEKQHKVV